MNSKLKSDYSAYFAAFLTVFLWGSAFPSVKYCLTFYSPESIMLLRYIVASITLGAVIIVKKVGFPKIKDLPLFIIGGFVGIFIYTWLFNTGTSMVKSGVSSFIIASSPVFLLVFSIIFLKEKASIATWLGVAISAIGLIIVAVSQVDNFTFNRGIPMLVLAAMCMSTYTIIQRKITRIYSPIMTSAYCIIFATVFMLAFTPKLISEMPSAPIAANLLIVYQGIFPAAIAYLSWGFALSRAKKTSNILGFLFLTPFIATIIAFFGLHETLTIVDLSGGVIIIAGMVIMNKFGK